MVTRKTPMDHSASEAYVTRSLSCDRQLFEACCAARQPAQAELESRRDLLLSVQRIHQEGFRSFLLTFLQAILREDSRRATEAAAILAVLALDDCDQRAAAILEWDSAFLAQLHLALCSTAPEDRH